MIGSLLTLLFSLSVASTAKSTLFFYNPESNINDFRSVKTLFDSYLTTNGVYQFQPFDDKTIFENFVKTNKEDVFLLSSWHYQNLVERGYAHLQPILVGTIDGNFTYTQVLSTKKNVKDINQLQGKRIASAASEEYTKNILENMAQQELKVGVSFEVLTVPKDIDALMSVLFGMAQGALTASNSLTTLATLNPKKAQLLRQQAKSEAVMLPLVVAYSPLSKSSTSLLDVIKNMPDSPAGKEILGRLGLNGWRKLTSADLQQLESVKD